MPNLLDNVNGFCLNSKGNGVYWGQRDNNNKEADDIRLMLTGKLEDNYKNTRKKNNLLNNLNMRIPDFTHKHHVIFLTF